MIPALLTEPSHHVCASNLASLLSPHPPAQQQSRWAAAQGPWLPRVRLCCSVRWIAFFFYKTVPTKSSSSLLDFSGGFNFYPRSLLLALVSPRLLAQGEPGAVSHVSHRIRLHAPFKCFPVLTGQKDFELFPFRPPF